MDFEGETCVKVEKPEKMRTQNNPHKLLLTIFLIHSDQQKCLRKLDYLFDHDLKSETHFTQIISIHLRTMC